MVLPPPSLTSISALRGSAGLPPVADSWMCIEHIPVLYGFGGMVGCEGAVVDGTAFGGGVVAAGVVQVTVGPGDPVYGQGFEPVATE
jgi:hypothetical protein